MKVGAIDDEVCDLKFLQYDGQNLMEEPHSDEEFIHINVGVQPVRVQTQCLGFRSVSKVISIATYHLQQFST